MPDRNPFLEARQHAKAKQAIENRYQQELQLKRIKQAEYKRDLHELIEQPSKQRDAFKEKILEIQHQQAVLEEQRLEAIKKHQMYKDAAEAGKGAMRDKWKDDEVYDLVRPVEAPPKIPAYPELPTEINIDRDK